MPNNRKGPPQTERIGKTIFIVSIIGYPLALILKGFGNRLGAVLHDLFILGVIFGPVIPMIGLRRSAEYLRSNIPASSSDMGDESAEPDELDPVAIKNREKAAEIMSNVDGGHSYATSFWILGFVVAAALFLAWLVNQ